MQRIKKITAIILSVLTLSSVCVFGSSFSAGAKGTGAGLAEWALNAYNSGWSYVYGGSTPGAVDCSGLLVPHIPVLLLEHFVVFFFVIFIDTHFHNLRSVPAQEICHDILMNTLINCLIDCVFEIHTVFSFLTDQCNKHGIVRGS